MKFFNVYYNIKLKDDIPNSEIKDIYNVGVFKVTKSGTHKLIVRGTEWDMGSTSEPNVNINSFLEEIFDKLSGEEEYQVTYQNEEE